MQHSDPKPEKNSQFLFQSINDKIKPTYTNGDQWFTIEKGINKNMKQSSLNKIK